MRPLLSGFAASTSPQLRRHMTVAMSSAAKQVSSWKAHGGHWTRHTHDSSSTGGQMTFSVFTPPGATAARFKLGGGTGSPAPTPKAAMEAAKSGRVASGY